jgi:hypothetical protein
VSGRDYFTSLNLIKELSIMAIDKELEARLDDIDAQLKHLFRLHGPAGWEQIQRQRKENAQATAQRPRFYATPAHGLPKEFK